MHNQFYTNSKPLLEYYNKFLHTIKMLFIYYIYLFISFFFCDTEKLIGKCVLGSYMFARGKAQTQWNTAFATPMEQVQQWHTLSE